MASTRISGDLQFVLNGRQVRIPRPEPTLLLIDYLRSPEVGLTGTKLSCGEGGCGACTVMLAWLDPADSTRVVERPINACLRPLCSIDGMAVTTIEHIGSQPVGDGGSQPNLIQERLAKGNGSQCGWCSPGFVMSMYGLLRNNDQPSPQDIEDQFDGNLCRCTGYAPILEAMRAFATDGAAAN